jgi:iron(III) transport system substrate-binding protein
MPQRKDRPMLKPYLRLSAFICGLLCCLFARADVVLYTSVDEPMARPIVDKFVKETGIKVRLVTDTEATKSIGLAERLRAEKDRPRCDVWWGNEPFHTVNLAEEGMFEPYESPNARDVRELFRDKQNRWAGNGLRARVIAKTPVFDEQTEHLDSSRLDGMTSSFAKGKIVMGKPAVGTIGGHVSAIYAVMGTDNADAFFKGLRENGVVLVGGNSPVPQQIAAGNFWVGLTDNDDVLHTKPQIAMSLPDQREGEIGTLAIPTTVALVKRSDIQDDSKRLIDYLLSADVEKALIDAKFIGWSVRAKETDFRAMKIDYFEVARKMPWAVRRAEAILEGREPQE